MLRIFILGVTLLALFAATALFDWFRFRRQFIHEKGWRITWAKNLFPISTLFPDHLDPAVVLTYRSARLLYNASAGYQLFDQGLAVDTTRWNSNVKVWNDGQCVPGIVLIDVIDGSIEDKHGACTDLRWNAEGKVIGAYLKLHQQHATKLCVMLHELAHVLGLDHTKRSTSIMQPVVSHRPETLDGEDVNALRREYKR